jgi:hypothetical protein
MTDIIYTQQPTRLADVDNDDDHMTNKEKERITWERDLRIRQA